MEPIHVYESVVEWVSLSSIKTTQMIVMLAKKLQVLDVPRKDFLFDLLYHRVGLWILMASAGSGVFIGIFRENK